MLYAGRYLFVLDGLEVMQHQEGDQYGLLQSGDLRQFLEYFAAPGHGSFCLVTSRAPLLNLMTYTTYTHRDVTRLSEADGRDLLREVGVIGSDDALSDVVNTWDGHALTLSLLGGYLADRCGGDVAHIGEIPPPAAGEERYERVHRVLRRYDEHLTEAERAFLTLFSAFRTPVRADAFEKVFRTPPSASGAEGTEGGLAELGDDEFQAMLDRLLAYRILRHDPRDDTYTTHPLIRSHYYARLTAGARADAADARIKDYYLELAGDTPYHPTLDDLAPLIEVVHHACRAGAYDEAWQVYWERISQRNRFVLPSVLGAWETELTALYEFFPGGDISQESQVSDPWAKGWILNEVGLCLMSLGRLGEAVPFYERANAIVAEMGNWHDASIGHNNLTELHAHLGALVQSGQTAAEALALARRAGSKADEMRALSWQAWAAHLRGEVEAASAAFGQAEALGREIGSSTRYLYSLRGAQHADHLRRTGDADYARRVAEANLEICQRERWTFLVSMCHRVLGDLDAQEGQHQSARAHYDETLRIARSITFRQALIEALLARGRHAAKHPSADGTSGEGWLAAAFTDLEEALGYAVEGSYRIYEADIRVALGWAHLAAGDQTRARQEARRAQQMSAQMGYHWGQVDAAELLAAIAEHPE
jgi:tetratricopeptide (TPR) repeat protein